MKKNISYKTRVGFFVVSGTILLVVALYFIGNRQHIFSKNLQVNAVFQNVNGLQVGNNVRYSGVIVGTVGKIEMLGESKIVVQMMVEEKTSRFIKKDAIATIGSDGLVGSMVVNILPGNKKLHPIVSGDTIKTYSKIGTDDMLSTLNVTNENAALLTADLLNITQKILKGEGALGVLISDSTMSKDIQTTLANLKKTSIEANRLFRAINQKVDAIDMKQSAAGVLLNDTIVGNQMRNTVLNLEKSSIDISITAKRLEQMILRIDTSDSAFNYLMKDEQLPLTVDSTLNEIKEASEKLNQNMEALKHNFFFRGYFKKQERKAKHEAKRTDN